MKKRKLNRREFLKRSGGLAAALAALWAVPSQAVVDVTEPVERPEVEAELPGTLVHPYFCCSEPPLRLLYEGRYFIWNGTTWVAES